jgi:hypothetical protein
MVSMLAYQLFLFCLCRASERSRHSDSKVDEVYNAVWKTEIFNDRPGKQYGNKLRTYRLFKNNFAFESYLDLDNFNRNILIRFRISAHNLEIEKGTSLPDNNLVLVSVNDINSFMTILIIIIFSFESNQINLDLLSNVAKFCITYKFKKIIIIIIIIN